jgi:hypothetical protein
MYIPNTREIEVYSTAEAMVNSYHKGIEALTCAYAKMQEAEKLLGKAVKYPCTLRDGRHQSTVSDRDLQEVICKNHKGAWSRIIDKMQLRYLLGEKRFLHIEEQIEKGDIPELTVENIYSLVQDLTSNIGDFLTECIRETFDWLIPHRGSDFKINKQHKIGPKVIKDFMVDHYSNGFRLDYRREQKLIALDNVFHLLDGKGPVKHPGNLVTTIKQTMRDTADTECETEYFKVRWFLKRTMHIWFTREDLLSELNRIGSGGKPHIGKQSG